MKLNKITEWIKKQITRHKNNSGQIDRDPERLPAFMSKRMNLPVGVKEAAEKKIKIDCTVSSYNASTDEQPMSNNRRKMKGIPMIRRQQLRRAQRNRRKKTNGWQQLGERKYWNQEENTWYTHKQ